MGLVGGAGEWRVRTGNYRIIYEIVDDRLLVLIPPCRTSTRPGRQTKHPRRPGAQRSGARTGQVSRDLRELLEPTLQRWMSREQGRHRLTVESWGEEERVERLRLT